MKLVVDLAYSGLEPGDYSADFNADPAKVCMWVWARPVPRERCITNIGYKRPGPYPLGRFVISSLHWSANGIRTTPVDSEY